MAGKLRDIFAFLCVILPALGAIIVKTDQPTTTVITASNATSAKAFIDLKIVDKPHHLFIGRCNPDHDVLHAENIVLKNDGKSHVNATIRFNIDAQVNITCVKVLDNMEEGEGAYPSFMAGGVGHNYVMIGVTTSYGKGFDFYVQIFGLPIEETTTSPDIISPSKNAAPYRKRINLP